MKSRWIQLWVVSIVIGFAGVVHPQQSETAGVAIHGDLVWNQRSGAALFVPGRVRSDAESGLEFFHHDGGFSVSLSQPLLFSAEGGYFAWWVILDNQPGQRMIRFKRDTGHEFHAEGLAADLQDFGEFKRIKTVEGCSFLFVGTGDGQWRLVELTNGHQQHLLIDYAASGRIERIRDDVAREATLQYKGDEIRQVIQTWLRNGNK